MRAHHDQVSRTLFGKAKNRFPGEALPDDTLRLQSISRVSFYQLSQAVLSIDAELGPRVLQGGLRKRIVRISGLEGLDNVLDKKLGTVMLGKRIGVIIRFS